MEPEPVTATPPRRVRAVLQQVWRDVAFLHWPLDPSDAAPLLPAGTRPDEFEGRTFAGVVALELARLRVLGGPPVPWLGTFGQVNVRLYSVDAQGRRGVVFRRMTADRLPSALAARGLTGLPYEWGEVRIERAGDHRTYAIRRGDEATRIEVRIGRAMEAGPLEKFLTARWGLHTRVAGRTVYVGVGHPPLPLRAAELFALDGDLFAGTGLTSPTGPPVSVLWSTGVGGVRIGLPAPIRPARGPAAPGRSPHG